LQSNVAGRQTSDQIADVLATQYMQATHGAVAMARLLAESDVIAAQQHPNVAMVHI
jgi:hypothetical protein